MKLYSFPRDKSLYIPLIASKEPKVTANLEDGESSLVDRVLADVLEGIKQQEILPSCPATHPYPLTSLDSPALLMCIGKVGGVETPAWRRKLPGTVVARDSPLQMSLEFPFSKRSPTYS